MIDLKKLFDLKYIFDSNPGFNFKFTIPALIIFGLMMAAAIILSWRIKQKRLEKVKIGLIRLLATTGVFGLLLLFFRNQGIMFFSTRILWIILFLVFLFWLVRISWYILRVMPKEVRQEQKKNEFEKYLPRIKRGSSK